MTYVLCDVDECYYHDGDGCTLDAVEITRRADLQEQTDGLHRPERAYCVDYDNWGRSDEDTIN